MRQPNSSANAHVTARWGMQPRGWYADLFFFSFLCYVMLCYTCLTSAFGTITVPRRRGIGPMQLRRKRAHPCSSRSQQTGTGWPSKPGTHLFFFFFFFLRGVLLHLRRGGTHQASSARESKPGPAHPHRVEVKMHDAASTRDGKQARNQSMMTRMQSKEICERVRKGKEESNASRARAGRGRCVCVCSACRCEGR
jgi:hypothetical protein